MSNQNDINNTNQLSAQEKRKAQLAARFASYQGGGARAKRSLADELDQTVKDFKEKLSKSSEVAPDQLQAHFDSMRDVLTAQFAKLDEVASQLNNHDRTKAQQSLEEFEAELQKKSDEMIPRKKFGFRNKANATETQSFKPLAVAAPKEATPTSTPAQTVGSVKKIENKENQLIVVETAGTLVVTGCKGCTVINLSPLTMLRVDNSKNCIVLSAPVSGSVYIEQCCSTSFQLCCRQFRAFKVEDCQVNLFVPSKPTIDSCKGLRFAPYSFKYDSFSDHFMTFGGEAMQNKFGEVQDFNWLYVMENDAKSPNWSLLPQEELKDVEWSSFKDKADLIRL